MMCQEFSIFILFNPPKNFMGEGRGAIITPILNKEMESKKINIPKFA